MADLNHYFISNVLKARIEPGFRGRFGLFGASRSNKALSDALAASCEEDQDPPASHNQLIAEAFEETRQGYAPDVVLATSELAQAFFKRCRGLGVKGSRSGINRRLLRFRKSPPPDIRLARATRESDANASPYVFAAEIAMAQMKYRHDVTVDDLLIYPEIAKEFFVLANRIREGGRLIDYIGAALNVRKNRKPTRDDFEEIEKIRTNLIENKLRTIAPFSKLKQEQVPMERGIFTITEEDQISKDLYIGAGSNLRVEISPFQDLAPFYALQNTFWQPDPSKVFLKLAVLKDVSPVQLRGWHVRLIQERQPLFNYIEGRSRKDLAVA